MSCTTDGRDARSDAADACIVDAAVVAGAVDAGVGSGGGKGGGESGAEEEEASPPPSMYGLIRMESQAHCVHVRGAGPDEEGTSSD